jgi:hypothetical protein
MNSLKAMAVILTFQSRDKWEPYNFLGYGCITIVRTPFSPLYKNQWFLLSDRTEKEVLKAEAD